MFLLRSCSQKEWVKEFSGWNRYKCKHKELLLVSCNWKAVLIPHFHDGNQRCIQTCQHLPLIYQSIRSRIQLLTRAAARCVPFDCTAFTTNQPLILEPLVLVTGLTWKITWLQQACNFQWLWPLIISWSTSFILLSVGGPMLIWDLICLKESTGFCVSYFGDVSKHEDGQKEADVYAFWHLRNQTTFELSWIILFHCKNEVCS